MRGADAALGGRWRRYALALSRDADWHRVLQDEGWVIGRSGGQERSGLLAVGAELLQVGEDVVDVGLVGEAREDHLGARHLGLRVLDVFAERRFVPCQAGILVGLGVAITFHRTGMAANHAIEDGADRVLGGLADLVTDLALEENLFACSGILGLGSRRRGGEEH